ncbi:hypothetical protein [Bifidobacterium tissieri]|uniref:Uncharacterized protein n=1 Tax=Bifidobacterium tissieri TaxID=1630162 RepID=A0A5M9ZMZ3_9BIFI|nr:hypothetical protein [Bifidobacterium tissieri]KAA8828663.1 hypothetical protein EM849_11540 [Bifidobacterium tissieri]KAA8831606.1 hypothetical protein EMO89_02455 [Bifidobacterium tissieri]
MDAAIERFLDLSAGEDLEKVSKGGEYKAGYKAGALRTPTGAEIEAMARILWPAFKPDYEPDWDDSQACVIKDELRDLIRDAITAARHALTQPYEKQDEQ